MNTPLPYLQRIRDYYLALGYETPYRWASYEDVPFTQLQKPLTDASITIVTTAAPFKPNAGDQGPGAPYNGKVKFFSVYSGSTEEIPNLGISHIAIDRTHTTAEDIGTYFPLRAFQQLAETGEIGALAPRFHGLPTNRSQKTTLDVDCSELVKRCHKDNVDAAVLVPNCPVCHQSVTLAARSLEESGIPTVIMGCAKDIVEHVGAPRLLFNDFPLGNSAGLPNHQKSQIEIARLAVKLLENATAPRITEQSPYEWTGAPDWKKDYSNPVLLSTEEIARRREEFDRVKAEAPPKPDQATL